MKKIKLIITILIAIILLLVGFIIGKGFLDKSSEKQEEETYIKKYKQLSDQQSHDSAARMQEAFKNLDKTR